MVASTQGVATPMITQQSGIPLNRTYRTHFNDTYQILFCPCCATLFKRLVDVTPPTLPVSPQEPAHG